MENQQPIRPYDCTRDFIKFYDQYYDKVYRYVYVKVGNGWDTDDIVSDIFRKAYEKYATVKRNHASWLFTIARNTIVDFYWQKKKNLLQAATGKDEEAYMSQYIYQFSFNSFEEDAEDELERKEILSCLKKSLACLEHEELELISLKYFADMKYHDIGLLFNKSSDSVKMKTLRIIRKLKVLLAKCLEE